MTSVNFICSKGHRFSRSLKIFAQNQYCPICGMDTVAKHPHMVKQWHFKKNTAYDINLTPAGSKDTVWWRCKKCGYEWQAQIKSRKQSAGHCPCCEERVVVVKGITDLFTMVPDIKEYYDFEANNDINPEELSVTSHTQVNWKCDKCGYKWRTGVDTRIIAEDGKYKARACPSCIGQARIKSYGEEYPDLADRFEEELNGCSLYDITNSKFLNQNYYWNCDTCNEVFESALSSMIRARTSKFKGCIYCAGKKVIRENSFAALHPEIMDEYDPENSIDPYSVTEKSNRDAKWICRNNPNHKWVAKFIARTNGQGGCNICRGYNYGLMFYEEHSDFEQYYDTENNERPFNSYSNSSNEYEWWKCNKNHLFKWSIMNFSRGGIFKSPICTNKQLLVGENDLKSRYPDLAQEFDSEKNNILPEEILYTNTDDSIWWLCKEGHSFQRSIWYRVHNVRECPICNRTIVVKGINDFESTYPDIANIWDYEANERTPDTISDRNNDKYSFKCQKGHRYKTFLRSAICNDFQCLVCNFKLIQPGINSLVDTDSELAREWSSKNEKKPTEYLRNSSYAVLWTCPTCQGNYLYSIRDREVGDNDCPYCQNRKPLAGYNTLKEKCKKLMEEWNYRSNYLIVNPDTILPTYPEEVWWTCSCGKNYKMSPKKRVYYLKRHMKACPYCKGRRRKKYRHF